jgi:hypothetical protein
MFLISWSFTVVSLALASLIYKYVSIKGKAGDWGDGFKSAYFQLALRSLRSLGGICLINSIIYVFQVDDVMLKLVHCHTIWNKNLRSYMIKKFCGQVIKVSKYRSCFQSHVAGVV